MLLKGKQESKTIFGKTRVWVSKTSTKHNIPVVSLQGKVCCEEATKLYRRRITAIIGTSSD
nr:glycerate kinase [Clostridium putrefaciens]